MVIKGRTHEELWQFIIHNSLTELMKWGILTSRNKKLETTVIKIDQILRVVKGKSPPQTIMPTSMQLWLDSFKWTINPADDASIAITSVSLIIWLRFSTHNQTFLLNNN